MKHYTFVTVDVFTDRRFGGNPLAVFTDARGLSDEEMQSLARELNLSETTFVLPAHDRGNTARVRIFNRTAEMPFAGHPNVGTAFVLAHERRETGSTLRFEEIAGLVDVRLEHGADGAVCGATIDAPQPLTVGMAIPPEIVARCTGVSPDDILTGSHPPCVASVGMPFVIAEIEPGALGRAVPNVSEFRQALADRPGLSGRLAVHLYTRASQPIRARMFSPVAGTFEDPATGSANAALAALLLSIDGGDSAHFEVVQGVEMGRPSLMHTTARRDGASVRSAVGGSCVAVLRGEVAL